MKKNKNTKYIDCYHCVSNYGVVDRDCKICFGRGKIEDTSNARCNLCNDLLCLDGSVVPYGLHNVKIFGSFFSYYLLDEHSYTFNLCEKCIRNMFYTFKNPPKIRNTYGKVSYKKEKKYYEYMIWVDTGGASEAYLKGKCNFIKN